MPKKEMSKRVKLACLFICLGISFIPIKKTWAQDDDAAAEKAGKEFDDLDKQLDSEANTPQRPADMKEATKSLDQDLDEEIDQQAPVKAQQLPPSPVEEPKAPEKAETELTPEPQVAEPTPKIEEPAPPAEAPPAEAVEPPPA